VAELKLNRLLALFLGGLLLGACGGELSGHPAGSGGNSQGGNSQGGNSQGGSDSWTIRYKQVRTTLNVPAAAHLLTRVDVNGDGLVDLIAGDNDICFNKTPLVVLLNLGDGTYEDGTAETVSGDTSVDVPFAVSADFNGDGKPDIAVFDTGCKPGGSTIGAFQGGPPLLLLSKASGMLEVSSGLADAVETFNTEQLNLNSGWPYSGSNLHVKYVVTIDIDEDGDQDIFVESAGGENISGHFYLSNNDGSFVIDHENRLTNDAHHNNVTNPTHFWRHQPNVFTDLNGDEAPDLVMGQLRDTDPTHIDQSSIVLFNDQQGYFPIASRVLLPQPDFYGGHTAVRSIAVGDIDGDGHSDLVLAHARNDDVGGSPPDPGDDFTGRYIQVLLNRDGTGQFTDETATRMGDQSATLVSQYNVPAEMQLYDIDLDGDPDLITANADKISEASPLVYLNDGTGKFTVLDPEIFTDGNEYYGEKSLPLDLNNDGLLDFTGSDISPGTDGRYGTGDDVFNFDSLVAQPN